MGSLEEACLTGFLCRLCSKMHRSVIHIYGEEGLINRLEFKINTYLPVTIAATDPLPKTICKPCFLRLDHHHKLMDTVNANTIKLKEIFAEQARLRESVNARQQRTTETSSQTNIVPAQSTTSPNIGISIETPSTSTGTITTRRNNNSNTTTMPVILRTSNRLKLQAISRAGRVRKTPYRKCKSISLNKMQNVKQTNNNKNKRKRKK